MWLSLEYADESYEILGLDVLPVGSSPVITVFPMILKVEK
jgi:hypothetical protein